MSIRVIDSDNYAEAGIETMFFPGGEPHVKVPKFEGPVLPFLKLRTWADVGFGALLVNALQCQPGVKLLSPFIPYFPAARQDRSDGTAAVSVQVIARLFGDLRMVTFDVHSHMAEMCIGGPKRPINLMPEELDLPPMDRVAGVIAPDHGAQGRAASFRNHFCGFKRAFLTCSKNRDAQTGRLSNYALPPLSAPGRYIVVDDICDGGGTFNLLAEAWKRDPLAKDSQLELFVSHGIFSKGLDAIDPVYERITTTDSWCRLPSTDRLTVIPLFPQLLQKFWS